MSNVKDVSLLIEVPFNLFDDNGPLTGEDMSFFCRMFLSPSTGLRWDPNGITRYVDNDTGGQTAIDQVVVSGREAISYKAIDHLVELVKRVGGGLIDSGFVRDMEDRSARPVEYS